MNNEEIITPDPDKHYLTEEPFFTDTVNGVKLLLQSAEWWEQARDESE